MADYMEEQVAGKTWVRFNHISVSNQINENPVFSVNKEQILEVAGKQIASHVGQVSESFSEANATETFEWVDSNGVLVQTLSYQDAYNILKSLCFHIVLKADSIQGG